MKLTFVAAAQATQLVLDLQTLAHNAGHPVPLLIAIDQENGGVTSLYDEVYIRQFPSAMGMAAAGSRKPGKRCSSRRLPRNSTRAASTGFSDLC